MFFVILIVIFFLVFATLVLPVLNGLGSYKLQPTHHQPPSSKLQSSQKNSTNGGYISPEQQALEEAEAKKSKSKLQRLKNKLNVTKDDIPLKFNLNTDGINNNGQVRRRKVQTFQEMNDPNTFDYDLDEFDYDSDEERQKLEMQKNAARGNEYWEEIA